MQLQEVIWLSQFVEKLAVKHGVTTEEVDEILFGQPFVRFWQKGQVRGEDLYLALRPDECRKATWWSSSFSNLITQLCLFQHAI